MRLARLLGLCGILGSVVGVAAWVVAEQRQLGYSIRRNDISALGALNAEHAWVYNGGVVASGVLTLAFAAGLFLALGDRLGPGTLAVYALTDVLDGFLRLDCATTRSRCQARNLALEISWHDKAHLVESVVSGAALVLAPFLLGWTFGRDPRWRALKRPSYAAGAVLVLFGAAYFPSRLVDAAGLDQRAFTTVGAVWIAVIAYRLIVAGEPRTS